MTCLQFISRAVGIDKLVKACVMFAGHLYSRNIIRVLKLGRCVSGARGTRDTE